LESQFDITHRDALAMIKIERKTSVFPCSEAKRSSGVQQLRFIFDVLLFGKESERERLIIKKYE